MIQPLDPHSAKLPYPTRWVQVQGAVIEEYIIPEDRKQEVLEELYPFTNMPSLDDEMFDLHEGQTFIAREYRVFWEKGMNWLVSPYYPNSGGSVIDWVSADDWVDDPDEDEFDDEWDDDWEGDDLPPGPTDREDDIPF